MEKMALLEVKNVKKIYNLAQGSTKALRLGYKFDCNKEIYFALAKSNEKVAVGSSIGSPFTFTPVT